MNTKPGNANRERRINKSKRELVQPPKSVDTFREHIGQFISIFDAIGEKVYVSDPETHEILYANPAKKRYLGEDVLGQKCYSAFHGLNQPCDFCTNPKILGENVGKTHIWEFQNRKTGKWVRCIDRAIQWPDGRMVRFEMAIAIDDRKTAEESLRMSEERYRSIVENIHEGIYATDETGRITYVSPVIESLTGYSQSEIIGQALNKFVLPEDLEHIRERSGEILSGKVKATEFRLVKKSGETMWVRTFSKPVFQDGKAVGLRGVLLDITEYKGTEAALQASEARYRLLIETMNEGFSITNERGIRTYANSRLAEMLGYKAEEIIGRPATAFLDEESVKTWTKEFEKRKKSHSSPYQMNLVRKDGEKVPVIVSPRPVFDDKGVFRGSFAAITDVSHLKRTEKALKEREKELKVKTASLEELNAALRVLLRRMEEERREIEEKVRVNIQQMIHPYLERLKAAGLGERQRKHLSILVVNLQEILSPFTQKLLTDHPMLTPSELQIANLIRQGRSSKEIADELGLSQRTEETHRRNMRTKLGIKDKKTNLRSYLIPNHNQYT